jgi:hypothetical protein
MRPPFLIPAFCDHEIHEIRFVFIRALRGFKSFPTCELRDKYMRLLSMMIDKEGPGADKS